MSENALIIVVLFIFIAHDHPCMVMMVCRDNGSVPAPYQSNNINQSYDDSASLYIIITLEFHDNYYYGIVLLCYSSSFCGLHVSDDDEDDGPYKHVSPNMLIYQHTKIMMFT